MADRVTKLPTILPEPAPITIGQIKKAIPAHLFERSALKSLYYTFRDLVIVGILFYISSYIDYIPLMTIRWICWIIYWILQGSFMTGLWVIAHECGHGAFSPSVLLNDIVGSIIHTSLLVPYWSWKYSHSQHHSNTDNMERDTVFVPYSQEQLQNQNPFNHTTLMRFIGILKMTTLGWPFYLLFDISGPPIHVNDVWTSHFNPFCKLFVSRKQKLFVVLSDVMMAAWIYLLIQLSRKYTFIVLLKLYLIPYLIVNFWLVTITFLQHTDRDVPRYRDNEWNWLRGALGTVDRDYGLFNIIHHHIADTHVVHHIFSKIPHYNAVEATKYLKQSNILNDYYLYDNTPWYIALWNSYRDCWFVGHEQITFFQSCYDKNTVANQCINGKSDSKKTD